MSNKIKITVLESKLPDSKTGVIAMRVPLEIYDKVEMLARRTHRTRSDVAKIIMSQVIDSVDVEEREY